VRKQDPTKFGIRPPAGRDFIVGGAVKEANLPVSVIRQLFGELTKEQAEDAQITADKDSATITIVRHSKPETRLFKYGELVMAKQEKEVEPTDWPFVPCENWQKARRENSFWWIRAAEGDLELAVPTLAPLENNEPRSSLLVAGELLEKLCTAVPVHAWRGLAALASESEPSGVRSWCRRARPAVDVYPSLEGLAVPPPGACVLLLPPGGHPHCTGRMVRRSASARGDLLLSAALVRGGSDGGARGNPGLCGFGAFLYSPCYVAAPAVRMLAMGFNRGTNNYMEWLGLIACLRMAVAASAQIVHLVCDSRLVVHQLAGKAEARGVCRLFLDEAETQMRCIPLLIVDHVRREGNKMADWLSNVAKSRSG
jgi:ribonuclease HI